MCPNFINLLYLFINTDRRTRTDIRTPVRFLLLVHVFFQVRFMFNIWNLKHICGIELFYIFLIWFLSQQTGMTFAKIYSRRTHLNSRLKWIVKIIFINNFCWYLRSRHPNKAYHSQKSESDLDWKTRHKYYITMENMVIYCNIALRFRWCHARDAAWICCMNKHITS